MFICFSIGDYKLILGFPGRFDGYTQDQNIGLIEQVDILGLKGDSSPTEQGASGTQLQDYMQLIDGVPQLYNVMGEFRVIIRDVSRPRGHECNYQDNRQISSLRRSKSPK